MASQWRRACVPCTKAKRQCTKQTPSCRRCILRGAVCEYPPPRRPAAALSSTLPCSGVVGPPAVHTPELLEQNRYCELFITDDVDLDPGSLDFDQYGPTTADTADQHMSNDLVSLPPWFLLPSSWKHEHELPRSQEDVSAISLQTYISTIKGWFYSWVSNPLSNPLIHPELYRREMPRCVQDTYTAVSAYQHKTAANSDTILRIVGARVEQLIQEQSLRESLGDKLTTSEHLARVHALLAYQSIMLFDGDVRARARADEMVGTLFEWCEAMWRSTREAYTNCLPHRSLHSTSGRIGGVLDDDSSLWHAFIHLESVRRAFLTANIIQHVYLTLKNGWSACPGGVTISIRRGVWEARSAYTWKKLIKDGDKDPLLGLQTMRLEDILERARPMDVDDFGLALMGVHFAEEKLEQWLDEKGRRPIEANHLEPLLSLGL